jgi:hypothetical protein
VFFEESYKIMEIILFKILYLALSNNNFIQNSISLRQEPD